MTSQQAIEFLTMHLPAEAAISMDASWMRYSGGMIEQEWSVYVLMKNGKSHLSVGKNLAACVALVMNHVAPDVETPLVIVPEKNFVQNMEGLVA